LQKRRDGKAAKRFYKRLFKSNQLDLLGKDF
jgi:transposase-like protein